MNNILNLPNNLIDASVVTPTPYAELVAQNIIDVINFEIARRVLVQKDTWTSLWENPKADPTDIITALGSNIATVFAVATENCEHINRSAQAVGKTVGDYLDAKYLSIPDAYKSLFA